jgi:hypothetical protein
MENPGRVPNHTRQGSALVSEKGGGSVLGLHNFVARMVGHCIAGGWMKTARAIPFRRNDDNTASEGSARTARFDSQIERRRQVHGDRAASESE